MSSDCAPGKSSWPELVGEIAADAAARIERENPNVNAILVQQGDEVTGDFDCNRVIVWVHQGRVIEVPAIG